MQDTTEILSRFVRAQGAEFHKRHELYGADAKHLDEFSGGASSLDNPLDVHVRVRSLTQEAAAVIAWLNRSALSSAPLLFDAGCGIGTQAIAYAALGYDVTGIELNEGFVTLAKKRVEFYHRHLGTTLCCRFLAGSIFEQAAIERYDVIWAREAISHIHPLEQFLVWSHRALKPGGILTISDANWSNPLVKLELFRSYWRHYRPFRTRGEASIYYLEDRIDPQTGKQIPMAMERVMTLSRTLDKLRAAGFPLIKGRTLGYLPKTTLANLIAKDVSRRIALFDLLSSLEALFGKILCLRSLGATNIVVATKE